MLARLVSNFCPQVICPPRPPKVSSRDNLMDGIAYIRLGRAEEVKEERWGSPEMIDCSKPYHH